MLLLELQMHWVEDVEHLCFEHVVRWSCVVALLGFGVYTLFVCLMAVF